MKDLAAQKCLRHRAREAVALCPECGKCFCRECISEHDGRILCTRCLKAQTSVNKSHRKRLGRLLDLTTGLVGLLLLWMIFFYFGEFLLSLPTSFHEGTLWTSF